MRVESSFVRSALLVSIAALSGIRAARAENAVVTSSVKHDLSPPLRSLGSLALPAERSEPSLNLVLPNRWSTPREGPAREDACYVLAYAPRAPMPPPLVSFEGVGNLEGRVPPDTNADVGRDHIVQWVNLSFAVYDRDGRLVFGPGAGNTLWAGFGGICETSNNGDPVVLYDQLAGRWFMSQLAFEWPHNFHQCIAVSQSEDPTASWYRYDFFWAQDTLNDYPKFGIWPDAYYMAVNQFDGPTQAWRGQAVAALERDRMLAGESARMVRFDLYATDPDFGAQLPSHLVGPLPPPAGSPNYFIEVDDDSWGWPTDRLQVWRFHVDWADPGLSTFGVEGQPDRVIDLSAAGHAFDSNLCGYASGCLPQPGGARVDALSDRLMYRLAYRNYGTHESLVLNHTVDVDGLDHAGVRWYELRIAGGLPQLYQGGTHAPDGDHRWMASASMDGAGNLAVGYSVSGVTTYPSIRFAGREVGDPPGVLDLAEAALAAGSGYQEGASRWGDYSSLSVDPVDDCTFWYTQEYYATVGPYPWQTRIGSFRLDSCSSCPLVGVPVLHVARESGGVRLSWTAAANAAVYDAVEGDLTALRGARGDYSSVTSACVGDDLPSTVLSITEPVPAPGEAVWYLVRGERGRCRGTFGERVPSLHSARDPAACP